MSQYRILKADMAFSDRQEGDEWRVPYRIQKRVWCLWPILKRWEWVTGKHIQAQHTGERCEIVETYDEAINFATEDEAKKFIIDNLTTRVPATLKWEIITNIDLK